MLGLAATKHSVTTIHQRTAHPTRESCLFLAIKNKNRPLVVKGQGDGILSLVFVDTIASLYGVLTCIVLLLTYFIIYYVARPRSRAEERRRVAMIIGAQERTESMMISTALLKVSAAY